ncbi:hypothetical protein AB4Y96_11345 [Phyllobacterium sp. TAF24]|uniref:hypothetical protein n=1 Tax=Phyllobacterium sp. TAF24 TaxID=3233068 RepID=UPI003F96120E
MPSLTAITFPGTPLAIKEMPAHYEQVTRRNITIDGEPAELVRCERLDGRNKGLGGEHISFIVDMTGKLKGFARMDLILTEGNLPSTDEAREIAMIFLKQTAPDLLPKMDISWIRPHDEVLRLAQAGKLRTRTVTGMKVKMRNPADGRWFWVIVGADREVMVFERDIVWITFPGRRKTEKWLHDSWLTSEEKAGMSLMR